MAISNIETICPNPGCDKDITLDAAKIKRAIMRKGQTKGKALIGCPLCAHVMVLPKELPTDMVLFDEYITKKAESKNWLDCVPMLDPTQIRLPVGHVTQAGTTLFRPGGGTGQYDKYTYMVLYGIDPEIAEYKSGIKPTVVGNAGEGKKE